MVISKISELRKENKRAIIINYNTKYVTLLSLFSALRFAHCPVLLIDCHSTDESFTFFEELMKLHDFDLLSLPLNVHGKTLDLIFSQSSDEKLLLLDSDLELLNDEIIEFMDKFIDHRQVFGSGFLLEAKFLRNGFEGTDYYNAYLIERPWMPIALFRVDCVKKALEAGYSFAANLTNNEYSAVPPKMVWLVRMISKFMKNKTPTFFRHRYFVFHPSKIFYDTGAKVYEYLRYKKFLFFVNIPEPFHRKYVSHYWGVTRKAIDPSDVADFPVDMDNLINGRLFEEYGFKA